MKLVAFSDTHGTDLGLVDPNGADICVIAGDIAPLRGLSSWDKRKQASWMNVVFGEFVSSHPETEFVFVAGNHDFWGVNVSPNDASWPKNAHYLRNSECEVCGLRFWGTPNIPPISGKWAFETSEEGQRKVFGAIPEGLDVLIAHSPPKFGDSTIDVSLGMPVSRQCHFGSEALADAITEKQPRYFFCGHIHSGNHNCFEIGCTQCFNVSVLDERYDYAYTPCVIEDFF